MKKMKISNYITGCLCLLTAGLWGCMDDKGNYDYDFDSVSEIEIDTTGMDKTDLWSTWNVNDTIHISPKVKYNKPEQLAYYWLAIDYVYQAETVGNSQVFPPADTLCRTLDLDYIVGLEAGKAYQLWLVVKDTVLGLSASLKFSNYLDIPEAGAVNGIYCLQEKDGRIDIDVFGTPASLIFGEFHTRDYWSSMHPNRPLAGNARSIHYSGTGKWYYIFTDQEGIRCSPSGLVVMDEWNDMFYDAPACRPEAFRCVNNYAFLINDGRLHCLNIPQSGDRKFPAPLSGDYRLAPFLAYETRTTWRPVAGAIDAYQVVYDAGASAFRPYFNRASQLGGFSESVSDAIFDVNHMQGELVYSATVNGGETMAVMKRDGAWWMDVACFYNIVDKGNLARSTHSLSGCTDIGKASVFLASNAGPALFYAVGNTLHSYSYTTGQTESVQVWSSDDPNDEITCMQILPTGGFPTGGRILWVAVWNRQNREGRIVEFEISPQTGKIEDMFGPMFGAEGTSPRILEGFGKVISMTCTL